jgi:predicted cupin superfamily sugar epimerase
MSTVIAAADIITTLSLQPHPEGGHYRETWRDKPADGSRGAGTAIYYLLRAGEISRWHRVDATEVWHWYAGAPLLLRIAPENAPYTQWRVGPPLTLDVLPQRIVPTGVWQSAQSEGAWTLVGCTVSPAFDFKGFELAPIDWEPSHTSSSV